MSLRPVLTSFRGRAGLRVSWLMAALLAAAAPAAHAAVDQLVYGMLNSGTAPFDAAGGPGKDTAAGDTVIRTNDQVSYRVGYSLAPSDANPVITVSMGATALPGGYSGSPLTPKQIASFSAIDLPTGANGCANIVSTPVAWPPVAPVTQSGVSADGQHIVCWQPGPLGGANMDFIARVGGAAPNGTTIAAPTVGFGSDGNTGTYTPTVLNGNYSGVQLYGAPTLTVSAAPRWKVVKTAATGTAFLPGSGPGGQDGYVVPFNIGVYAEGSRKGLEALQPNFTIAENFNDADMPNARFVDWNINLSGFSSVPMGPGPEPSQQNGCGDWRDQLARLGNYFDNTFYQVNDAGAVNSTAPPTVARGGTCMATAVEQMGKTATLEFAGTDFSLAHYPVKKGTGGPALVNAADADAPTNQWWVASKSVLIWVPLSDLTPNVQEFLTNQATLSGTSVTGQTNPPSNSSADAGVTRFDGGNFGKVYSQASNVGWDPAVVNPLRPAACDPNVTGDCHVNQVAPGQLVASRLYAEANAASFSNGYICDKIDNARFTLADIRASAGPAWPRVDANTGIVVRYFAGTASTTPLTLQLGVGGNGIAGGTWATRSNVVSEYPAPSHPSQSSGDQALSSCGDADATWYNSIADLITAGRSLAEVTRVRATYTTFGAANGVMLYIPLTVNANYAYAATETGGTTHTLAAGASTVGSIAPNQAMWLHSSSSANPSKASDALRITQTEYAQISKRALAPHGTNNGQVSRGAYVSYELQVNLTSTTNPHTASNVIVWDVLPDQVDYVPGSSTWGGAPLADPTCTAAGTTPASGPFAANSVSPGFKACFWALGSQPVVEAPRGDATGNLPVIGFKAVVSLNAPAGTPLLNTSFADSSGNLLFKPLYSTSAQGFACTASTVPCSYGNWALNVSSATGVAVNKAVSAGVVIPDTGFSYDVAYAAAGADLAAVRVLDVLPYSGDSRGNVFSGTLQLTAPIATPVADAGPPAYGADAQLVVRYTSNAPANINRNPYDAGHNLTGGGSNTASATNWCTAAQFGTANCPASVAQATAFMAMPNAGASMPAGVRYRLTVPVQPTGNQPGDVYFNDFVLDSPDLTARRPGSNLVKTEVTGLGVPAQTVSGRVYREASSPPNTADNGPADPGLAGVTVRLVCTAPPNYDETVITAADGSFSFSGVTSGAECTLTETQPAGYENAYNTPGLGGTGQSGDSGTGDSTIDLTVPYGGSSGNAFAEKAPVGADMVSAVTCTPNPANPGAAVSCTATCTNQGTAAAIDAVCSITNAATLPGAPAPICTGPGVVMAGATLSCTVDFSMPAGGGQTVEVKAGTGAVNDSNGGAVLTAGNNPSSSQVRGNVLAPIPTLGWAGLSLLAALLGLGAARRRRAA